MLRRRWVRLLAAIACTLGVGTAARGQDSLIPSVQPPTEVAPAALVVPPSEPSAATPLDPAAVKGIIADYLKEQDAKKKADEDAKKARGHEVGSVLAMNAYWDNGLWFATPGKDWKIHVGGRFQFEPVFWQQPKSLQGPQTGPGGVPAAVDGGGVGVLDDGMFFRRVRFRSDGVGYETFEYALEVDFEQLNYVTFDHIWVGTKDEHLGTLRVGQHKVPMGMEMMGSDYHLTFLEDRSALFDSFWTLFAPGVFYANNFDQMNGSFQTMFSRIQPTQFYTSDFGDSGYASTNRATWTPLYKDDGAAVVHVGGSYQWRQGDLGRTIQPGGTGSAYGDSQNVVRFRARPELRDSTGIGAGTLGGNSARFVDTGFLLADDIHTVSPEFLLILGPFSLQTEAAFAWVPNARSLYGPFPVNTPHGTPLFWGTYAQVSYFLTGEHRGYDRRFGTYDRPKVRENAFLVRGDDGCLHWGTGAWELAYRYSFVDLNDNDINGGLLLQHSVGLNWYLNDNTKLQFMYNLVNRNVIPPAVSGTVHGFGMLAQWYF